MDNATKLKMVQTYYAALQVDTMKNLELVGGLEQVIDAKREEQLKTGGMKAQKLGIKDPEQIFHLLSAIFECADWKLTANDEGFTAVAKNCKLCAMAKQMGVKKPCNLFCLDPMEGMVKGAAPGTEFEVEETLWDGNECRVNVKKG